MLSFQQRLEQLTIHQKPHSRADESSHRRNPGHWDLRDFRDCLIFYFRLGIRQRWFLRSHSYRNPPCQVPQRRVCPQGQQQSLQQQCSYPLHGLPALPNRAFLALCVGSLTVSALRHGVPLCCQGRGHARFKHWIEIGNSLFR